MKKLLFGLFLILQIVILPPQIFANWVDIYYDWQIVGNGPLLPSLTVEGDATVTGDLTVGGEISESTPFVYDQSIVKILNPYSTKTYSLKGQTHAHTNDGDGDDNGAGGHSTAFVLTAYRDAGGYDFVVTTPHNALATPATISGIVHIVGVEEDLADKYPHIGGINITATSTSSDMQTVIDKFVITEGGLAQINHPDDNSGWGWSNAEIASQYGAPLIEVWNAANSTSADRYGEDEWDRALSRGQLLYGTATDDSHRYAESLTDTQDATGTAVSCNSPASCDFVNEITVGEFIGSNIAGVAAFREVVSRTSDDLVLATAFPADFVNKDLFVVDDDDLAYPQFNEGWIVVNTDTNTAQGITDAIENGNFYASNGADISISLSGRVITATTTESATIEWIISGGYDSTGTVTQTDTTTTSATYTVIGNEVYVIAKVTWDSDSSEAWPQPLMITTTNDLYRQDTYHNDVYANGSLFLGNTDNKSEIKNSGDHMLDLDSKGNQLTTGGGLDCVNGSPDWVEYTDHGWKTGDTFRASNNNCGLANCNEADCYICNAERSRFQMDDDIGCGSLIDHGDVETGLVLTRTGKTEFVNIDNMLESMGVDTNPVKTSSMQLNGENRPSLSLTGNWTTATNIAGMDSTLNLEVTLNDIVTDGSVTGTRNYSLIYGKLNETDVTEWSQSHFFYFETDGGVISKISSQTGRLTTPTAYFATQIDTPKIISSDGTLTLQDESKSGGVILTSMSTGTFTNSAGTLRAVNIAPTYNQSRTAGATDLLINRTENALGLGPQLLIDLQADDVSKFKVNNKGIVIYSGSDFTGTPEVPTRDTNTWIFTKDLADDGNAQSCGTTDCIILPAVTTIGKLTIITSNNDYCEFFIEPDSTGTYIESNSHDNNCQQEDAIGDCDDTKICVFSDAIAGEAVTVDTFTDGGGTLNNGTWTGVTTASDGAGSGTVVTVIIAGGSITSVLVTSPGSGHAIDDTLTLDNLVAQGGGGDDTATVDIATIIDKAGILNDNGAETFIIDMMYD